jgi:quercetin dioxygenase-like cupin family protein
MRSASPLPSSTQAVVERSLDETITRLRTGTSSEAKALLIEARRLRSVIDTWYAIPPPANVRRDMLAKVMELAASVGHTLPSISGVTRKRESPPSSAPISEPLALSALGELDVSAEVPTASTRQPTSTWVRSRQTDVAPGVSVLRGDALPWRPFAMSSAVLAKVLRRDLVTGNYTALLRMPGGAELPAHRHDGPEEMYVIDGSLRIGDALVQAGDACHAEAGSVHPVIRTAGGCVLFLVASSRDQVL